LAWIPEGKRLLKRRRCNKENYIKMEFRVKKDVRVCSGFVWRAVVSTVTNLLVPLSTVHLCSI
jgi:hypothetical protein